MTELVGSKSGKPRVLVVDDEPTSRTVVSMRISSLGATTIEAQDGSSALLQLISSSFDAVILDLEMPGIDGFQLLAFVRGHPNLKHLPVIVISGRNDMNSVQRALEAGATSYLLKPLDWKAFSEHIRNMIGLRPSSEPMRNSA